MWSQKIRKSEISLDTGMPGSTPAGFCVFLSDPESKIHEKPDPNSVFHFGSSKSLCGNFLGKNMGKSRLHRWSQPESEQESDSRIWRIAKSGSGPGFKNFGTAAESESAKVTPATSAVHMHRETFYISNIMRKLLFRAKDFAFTSRCRVRIWLRVRKRKIIEV